LSQSSVSDALPYSSAGFLDDAGVASALIAFLIIRFEMALFDLKEGFCATSWGTAKRFCCAPHHSGPTGPVGDAEICGDWVEWGELFGTHRTKGPEEWVFGEAEFMAYAIIAVSRVHSLTKCGSDRIRYLWQLWRHP
jgi:chloride channel 3/4/5